MIDLNNCKEGDILICKHGVIKEYVRPTNSKDDLSDQAYDHIVKYLYTPYSSISSIESVTKNHFEGFQQMIGTVCNDGAVYRKKRMDYDSDVIKVIDRQVFKRYLKMLTKKL